MSPGAIMPCKSCGSEDLHRFGGEVAIHFRGLKNINKPIVFVFPEIVVCMDCGLAQFTVPDNQLRSLKKGKAAAG